MCFVYWNDSQSLCFNLESCCFEAGLFSFSFLHFHVHRVEEHHFACREQLHGKLWRASTSFLLPPTSDLAFSLRVCHFGSIRALLIGLFISAYRCLSLGKSSCKTNTVWFAVPPASKSGSLAEWWERHWCNSKVFRNVPFSRVCEGKTGWLAFRVFWVHLTSRTNAKLESSVAVSAWYEWPPL